MVLELENIGWVIIYEYQEPNLFVKNAYQSSKYNFNCVESGVIEKITKLQPFGLKRLCALFLLLPFLRTIYQYSDSHLGEQIHVNNNNNNNFIKCLYLQKILQKATAKDIL